MGIFSFAIVLELLTLFLPFLDIFEGKQAKLVPSCTNPARDEPGSASTLVNMARFQLSAHAVPIYKS